MQSVSKSNVQSKNLEKVPTANITLSDTKSSELKLNQQDSKTEATATTSQRSSFSSTIVSLFVDMGDLINAKYFCLLKIFENVKFLRFGFSIKIK